MGRIRNDRKRRERIKDVIANKLANIGPTATAIERLAVKAETIVDAFTDAGEFAISLRRREGSSPGLERIIDRILDSMEAVVEIPFEDEG